MDEEKTVWRGSSSHVINLGAYVAAGLVALPIVAGAYFVSGWLALLIVMPLGLAAWRWLDNHSRVYEVTTQRIRTTRGVLTRRTDDLELYRVKDTTLVQPLLLRLFSLGNVVLTTNDSSTPSLTIEAVRAADGLREEIRRGVETRRDQKRVRIAEVE
jgi:uncharacterized membrane protein YdbT with pleckstrin-like domain